MLHCWKGRAEDIEERFGFHSPEHLATYNDEPATCMRERDHAGEHDFTPDSQIGVTFKELG